MYLPLSKRHQGGFTESEIVNQHMELKVMLAPFTSHLCQTRLAELHGLSKQRASLSQLCLPPNLNPKSSVNTKMFIKKQPGILFGMYTMCCELMQCKKFRDVLWLERSNLLL